MENALGLFAILAVQKHCSEDRLFRFFWSEKFSREFSHELYNWGNCLWKANSESLKNFNIFLFFSGSGEMFVGLYEFIFSSAFPSDLSDRWSGKDLQHFSYHKKEKTISSEIVLVTRKCLESFQFCHEVFVGNSVEIWAFKTRLPSFDCLISNICVYNLFPFKSLYITIRVRLWQ